MEPHVRIAPSILSADFGALREALELMESAGADAIHVDVMDGHFVPNLTIGPPVVKALKRCCSIPFDVHLMIDNADSTVDWYLDAGADLLTVHIEACAHPVEVLHRIRESGAQAGVSLNPATPPDTIAGVLEAVDLILVMSVNPGFGGQSFIETSLDKMSEVTAMCRRLGVSPLLSIDGGINVDTGPRAVAAGARMLVAGNAVFCTDDPAEAIRSLR